MAFPIILLMTVTAEWSYYLGMIFLGVSWNLAFTGGRYCCHAVSQLEFKWCVCIYVCMYYCMYVFPPIVLGTVLLSWSYSPREKAGAQAVNDVCVFGISSLIALLSGLVSAATNR